MATNSTRNNLGIPQVLESSYVYRNNWIFYLVWHLVTPSAYFVTVRAGTAYRKI